MGDRQGVYAAQHAALEALVSDASASDAVDVSSSSVAPSDTVASAKLVQVVESVVVNAPGAMSRRCNSRAILAALADAGVYDLVALRAMLAHDYGALKLAIGQAAPPSFLALLVDAAANEHVSAEIADIYSPKARSRERVKRVLDIRRVELVKISAIDPVAQTFETQVTLEGIFPGGALDAALSAPGSVFPMDAHGAPTFRPSAGWFLDQIDFNNALSYKILSKHVKIVGNDIEVLLYFEYICTPRLEPSTWALGQLC